MPRPQITKRTAERLHRAAYDFEALAARFRSDGLDYYANSIKHMSSNLGELARRLDRELVGEKD
jgi:hypothetical protein